MKNLFYLSLLMLGFSSCSKYTYTPTPKADAQAMINHFRTSPTVSHEFDLQIKQFMAPSKVLNFLSKASDKIYFRTAAYITDHPSGDTYRKANMMTVFIWLTDKDNNTKEVIDIRDIKYKKPQKTGPSPMDVKDPTCVCPPPDCLEIQCNPDLN